MIHFFSVSERQLLVSPLHQRLHCADWIADGFLLFQDFLDTKQFQAKKHVEVEVKIRR